MSATMQNINMPSGAVAVPAGLKAPGAIPRPPGLI